MTIKLLNDNTPWIKAEYYNNTDLEGEWIVSYKIDGVRCIKGADGKIYTRNNKNINLPKKLHLKDCEFFYKDWETSMKIIHRETDIEPTQDMIYELDKLDNRLYIGTFFDLTKDEIDTMLTLALMRGYEGIVLRNNDNWIKVVPNKYADVKILDIKEGKGIYQNMAGLIVTTRGNVSNFESLETLGNLTDTEFRKDLLKRKNDFIGQIIQVGYREILNNGKLKFARLVRFRTDKDYESI